MREPNKYDLIQSQIRALLKEQDELRKARRKLGYMKLEKPIPNGWYKHMTLREDVARRTDAAVFWEILEFSGYKIWSREKKDLLRAWTSKKRKSRRYKHWDKIQYQGIRWICHKELVKLSKQAQSWYEGRDYQWKFGKGFFNRYFMMVPRHYFVPTYTRSYITERKVVDPIIEQRLEEIDQILRSKKYFRFTMGQRYHCWDWRWNHKRERRVVKTVLGNYDDDRFLRAIGKCFC